MRNYTEQEMREILGQEMQVSEQVEEEETAQNLIDRLKLIGDDGLALYMLDQELAQRVYNVPSPLAQA